MEKPERPLLRESHKIDLIPRWAPFVVRPVLVFLALYVFCMVSQAFIGMSWPTWNFLDWEQGERFVFYLLWCVLSYIWCLHYSWFEKE